MGILLRYACLLGLGLASIFAFVSASAVTGQRLAASGGYLVQEPADSAFMVLAVIGVLGFLSIVNFAVRGLPSLIGNWYEQRKRQLGTLVLAGVVCIVFLVL